MNNILLSYCWLIITATLAVYYSLGGWVFPDYQNYLIISKGMFPYAGGSEYLTRYVLLNDLVFISDLNRVDILAGFVQIFAIITLLTASTINQKYLPATAIFCSLYLPLIMTTTLRAGPLYVLFFLMSCSLFKQDVKFKYLVLLAISGSLFHDSVAILVLNLVFAYFLLKLEFNNKKTSFYLLTLSFLVLVFGVSIKQYILENIQFGGLGMRATYISGDKTNIAKFVYVIGICITSWLLYFDQMISPRSKLICSALTLGLSLLYVLSSTAAIRYSIFLMSYIIAVRGVLILKYERVPIFRVLSLSAYFIIFCLQYWMLL